MKTESTSNPPALGLESGAARLVPSNPCWPELFRAEADHLSGLLGKRLLSIVHVGSTAIPAIAAKPVLDLLAGVHSLRTARNWIASVEAAGYEFRQEEEIPDRLFFRKRQRNLRTHHLSLAEPNSRFYQDTLSFRNYLLAHPATARDYEALKLDLAAQYPTDREAYSIGKSRFVKSVLERAKPRSRGTGN